MSRQEAQRLADITAAITAIRAYLKRGELADGLIFDAIRVRPIEIGEAVKSIGTDLLDTEPGIPWTQIAAMRDRLAHRYFDTSHAIVAATITDDLPELENAVTRLTRRASDITSA